jgi:putative exosortase-associated protein (TIGR04073 family)
LAAAALISRDCTESEMYKKTLLNLLFVVVLLWCAPAWSAGDEISERSVRPFERFGRGLTNIITSPLELPAQIYNRASYQQEHYSNPFATIGGFLEGIPMGIIYFGWRLGAGCYDFATFPFERFDESIIDPEYVTFSYKTLLNE